MRPRYTIIIDTDHLADVEQPKRDWLDKWLRSASPRQPFPNICSIGCATSAEATRVVSMLTGRGLPAGASIVRGASS